MLKCLQPVVRDNYSAQDGNSVYAVQLDGGSSRFRQDQLNPAGTITVQWTLDGPGYDVLRAFYASVNYGADPFLIDLLWEAQGVLEYTVHFVPGTFKLTSQRGYTYVVQATLEVLPNGNVVSTAVSTLTRTAVVVALVANVATFNGALGDGFELTLTANCTGSTIINAQAGHFYTFCIIQNGVGGWTLAWPANVKNASAPNKAANSISVQTFYCALNGNLYPVGPMTYN
jgi:hypothetical protein